MSKHKLEYKDFVDATGDLVPPSFGYWFAGFTDGEGCFQIHQKNAPNPSWCCTFVIALRADDIDVLKGIEKWLTTAREERKHAEDIAWKARFKHDTFTRAADCKD